MYNPKHVSYGIVSDLIDFAVIIVSGIDHDLVIISRFQQNLVIKEKT